MTGEHALEVARGERFKFGENWSRFLQVLDEERIAEAVNSMKQLLGVESLAGKTFLDAGSGSGLFSLAARKLGARVSSFDFDPQSVACTEELKRRDGASDEEWTVNQASVLDPAYLKGLGQFDIVYSWGVLHHTGQMWNALANVDDCVKPGGTLVVAIYNDQGGDSRRWTAVKKLYVKSPAIIRGVLLAVCLIVTWWKDFLNDFLHFRPFHSWRAYKKNRGMSAWRDLVDWVGGYPFEVAKPEEIFEFYKKRYYSLVQLKTCAGGKGCNEFVFRKEFS
ncbi:MAG: class I SAM-dependent methyltransferase [Candidatus Sumerlaeaceae bacterium]|nr:class I SAM-dependent methyltransferase [Candidatus Sumerlaeaceae bacterium]